MTFPPRIKKADHKPLNDLASELFVRQPARRAWNDEPFLREITIWFLQYIGVGRRAIADRDVASRVVKMAVLKYRNAQRLNGDSVDSYLFAWMEEGSYIFRFDYTDNTGQTWDYLHQTLCEFLDGKEAVTCSQNSLDQWTAMERFATRFLRPEYVHGLLDRYRHHAHHGSPP